MLAKFIGTFTLCRKTVKNVLSGAMSEIDLFFKDGNNELRSSVNPCYAE